MNVGGSVVSEIMKKMPHNAEKYLTELSGGGFKLSIHWKLRNDPERPNKYSKTIVIDVPRELIEDFSAYPDHVQQEALRKIGDFVSSKLMAFDPDHNHPRGTLEPVENWSMSIERLFG